MDPATVASLKADAHDGPLYMGAHGARCRAAQRHALGNVVRDACRGRGASVCAGGTRTVADPAALGTAKSRAARLGGEDRSVAAAAMAPKGNPAQRASDVAAVWGDRTKRGLHLHPNGFGGT